MKARISAFMKTCTAAALAMLAGSHVWAACGDTDATSVGCDAQVEVIMQALVTFDITSSLGGTGSAYTLYLDYDGTTNVSNTATVCVGTNDTDGTAVVAVARDATGVTDGTNYIGYSLALGGSSNGLDNGESYTTTVGETSDLGCGTNVNLVATFTQADLDAAPAGTYTDTITFTVTPD